MDSNRISTLKTVCVAGEAREGFNGDVNQQLEQLADMGLLVVSHSPAMLLRRIYKPTEKGLHLYRQVSREDVA
ncbi:MAG TPA: hypothetical protein VKX49_15715 [Bryobacteraceae bacterium]|nr:hypothetical protein [Bryobacteraceae bacterium]